MDDPQVEAVAHVRARDLLLIAAVHHVKDDVGGEFHRLDRPVLLTAGVGGAAADVDRVVAANLQDGRLVVEDVVLDIRLGRLRHGSKFLLDKKREAALAERVGGVAVAANDHLARAGGCHELGLVAGMAAEPDRARHVERKLSVRHRSAEFLAARLGLHEEFRHALGALGEPRREHLDEQRPGDEHLCLLAGLGDSLGANGDNFTSDRDSLFELAAACLLGHCVGPFLLVERPAGDVVDSQLRLVGAGLLDEARPLPRDARVGILPVEVGDLQVVVGGNGDLARAGGLASHREDGAEEDAGVILRFQGLNRDRLAAAGPHGERDAVGLVGAVHVGIVDEHLHGVARFESSHRDVFRPPLAAHFLEVDEGGRDLGVGVGRGEEPLLRLFVGSDHGRVVVGDGDAVARDDLQGVVLGEVLEALLRGENLLAAGVGKRDRVDRRGVGLVVGDDEPDHPGPCLLGEVDRELRVVVGCLDRGRRHGEGDGDLWVLLRTQGLLWNHRSKRRLCRVEEHLEGDARVTVGVGIDVDPVHTLLQQAGDRQRLVRLRRDDAIDGEDVEDVLLLRLALGVEREGAGLVLLHLEAGVPVADVPFHAVEPERAVAAAEVAIERADRERLDGFRNERRTVGEPAAAEVVLELGDLRERSLGDDPREIHPWRAVPRLERGLAVGPPLADCAEVAAV